MDNNWRLGDDLNESDNILDGVTFNELIMTVRCNCQTITPAAVYGELANILAIRKQDMAFLVEKNMDIIIQEAMKGKGGYED